MILWQLGLIGSQTAVFDEWLLEEDCLPVTVIGTVAERKDSAYGSQWILTNNSVSCRGEEKVPGRLLISFRQQVEYKIGNRVMVTGELSHFGVPGNPGEFSLREYYRAQGVDYQVDGERWEQVRTSVNRPREFLANLRRRWKEHLEKTVGEEEAGVFAAVFLGDTSILPEETKELYQEGGISHILAVSGLHVSLLGLGLFRLLCRLPLPKRLPECLSAGVMAVYVTVAGASVSSRRALLLFWVLLLARILGRSYDMLSGLGLVGLLLLAAQPMQLFQAGFQLSFGTVASLGLLGPELAEWLKPQRKWQKGLLASLCAIVGTMPIAAWHYFEVAVSGIWLNLLVLPLASWLLLSAMLTIVFSSIIPAFGTFFAGIGHYILLLYRFFCEYGGKSIWTGRPELWQIVLYYGWLLLLVTAGKRIRKGREKTKRRQAKHAAKELGKGRTVVRWATLAVSIAVAFRLLMPFPDGGLTVVSLDVGQGDSTFFRTPEESCWLIDGGSSSVKSVGKKRILPFLKFEGVRALTGIVLSHSDADHINGILELLEEKKISVGRLILPKASSGESGWDEIKRLAAEAEIPVLEMEAGERWKDGEVFFTCLHPEAAFAGSDSNSFSLVLQVEFAGFRGLFPGDLGEEEERLFPEAWEPLTVLKIGHHGARGSSGANFLKAVHPIYGVISCGKKNSYGHPHKETLERLAQAGTHIYRTDENGAIRFFVKSGKLRVSTFR
ncbi:DNA internalization-related competence protein ComEC/Rec2 [Hominifimenecus sp. rT4P-3]|uniref:DNA internalization-related competence protein ComEC/Rec2 n=1 Tax=Hominifimenecus sp. rT4P-3 TaxID=3242979 RepID=UPI003DA5F751